MEFMITIILFLIGVWVIRRVIGGSLYAAAHIAGKVEERRYVQREKLKEEVREEVKREIYQEVVKSGGVVPVVTEASLFDACSSGDFPKVEYLLSAGVNPNEINSDGYTCLSVASFKGHTRIVGELLKSHADANLARSASKRDDTFSPLIRAASKGFTDIVSLLLKAGVNPNAVDNSGATALYWAACMGRMEALRVLLNSGADPTMFDSERCDALVWACQNGHSAILRVLLASGVKTNDPGRHASPLFSTRHVEIAKILIEAGEDVNQRTSLGDTPLMITPIPEIASLLIHSGCELEAIDHDGATALINASRFGYLEVVKVLLTNRANVNAKDNEGHTPLTYVSYPHWGKDSDSIAKLLKAAGALS